MIFVRLLSYLPFPILYAISNILAFIAYHILQYRRKVVFQNLRKSFPEKSEREIKAIAKKFYVNLSDLLVEIIKEYSLTREDVLKRITVSGMEELVNRMNNGQSVIMLAIHQCNWEYALLRAGLLSGNHPTDVVYKPQTNKSADEFMLKIRSRFGVHPISIDNTIREVARRSKITRMVVLLADQTPTKESDLHWAEFLNQETAFYKGPDVLARFTKYPVYYAEMTRKRRGFYHVEVKKVSDPPYDKDANVLPTFIDFGEKTIKACPENWLWSHRRWKLTKN